ncbi:hypothetical protein [Polyangium spumosum]|uniref:Lipoprotein n=1 Tax=Polyangium spumosum TaxID=889282 RepID=A0A6N7PJA7_9BACT|nr:hypothetical protein [Polyangium spumosum]MRG92068.1 hypothetical protein [Polyangium spumosum]
MKAMTLVLVALVSLALAGCEDKAKPTPDSSAKPAESAKAAPSAAPAAKPASTEGGGW